MSSSAKFSRFFFFFFFLHYCTPAATTATPYTAILLTSPTFASASTVSDTAALVCMQRFLSRGVLIAMLVERLPPAVELRKMQARRQRSRWWRGC